MQLHVGLAYEHSLFQDYKKLNKYEQFHREHMEKELG